MGLRNDGKYKDIEIIISDIEKSELEHNKRVAELTKNLKADIRNDIYAKDIRSNSACNSEALKEINEVSPTYEPHFILDQIIQYYIDKVNGIKTSMKVWQPDQETFQLAWEAGFRTAARRVMKKL